MSPGDSSTRRPAPEPLQPRPRGGLGSWPVIIGGAAVTAVAAVLTWQTAPCRAFHSAVELAGSDQRLATWLAGCPADLGDARASLGWELLLVVSAAVTLAAVLRRWWPLYEAPRLKAGEHRVLLLPLVAGVLGVVADVLILISLTVDDGRFAYPTRMALPITIATLSWVAWIAVAVAVLAGVMALMLAVARRGEPPPARPVRPPPVPQLPPLTAPEGLGVCCSGGGIRAAAFALGALERLESSGVMDRARWLSSVSGGSYAATAWRLLKADDPTEPAATAIIDWLQDPIRGSPAGRHRFLRNGPGGLGRPIVAAICYVLFNLVVLAALVYALAWPIGGVIGSSAVQPVLQEMGALPDQLSVAAELWLPGVIVLVAGVVVLAASALPSWTVAAWWRMAALLGVIGLVLEVFLVVTPVAMASIGRWMEGGPTPRASIIGSTALVGLAGTVWRIAKQPLIGRLSSKLPKLGGVLLLIVAVVWGGKVATDAAVGSGPFRSPAVWAAVAVGFVAVYACVGITQPTIHRIYRKRLRRTFGLARDASGTVEAPAQAHQLTWTQMPDDRPELVICCSQQRTGIAPGGLPAETFTISRNEVRIGEDVIPTAKYLESLPRDLGVERCVSSWIATSGAAFASAMGRMSNGSTNALMAALNIDLGIWLPNPRAVARGARFPKVRFGYTLKEILGWYDPADRYVFVADGGHWENLGLVELLRRRCQTIVCIDASGDQIGAFTTLRQAVELAGLELDQTVATIDLTALDTISAKAGALPTGLVASLKVTYRGPGAETFEGVIHYAKAQMASDLDIALRRFAKADLRFPNYSTGNQFLSDEQFRQLVTLGRAAGDRLTTLVAP